MLACSALKQAYRDRSLRAQRAGEVRFVYLGGDYDDDRRRAFRCAWHRYMPATLLESQFATLEEPTDAIVVDVATPIAAQVAQIRAQLRSAVSKA